MSVQKFNYLCLNEVCEAYMKKQIVRKEEEKEDEEEICTECGEKLKGIGVTLYGGYNVFNSLSSDEKQKILLKRSHNHFKKFVKDKKEHFNRTFETDVKEITAKQ